MADEPTTIRDGNKALVDMLTGAVAERNGSAPVGNVRGEIIKIAHGPDGVFTDTSSATPMPVGDFTPPLMQLGKDGLDVVANTVTPVVAANALRKKVSVLCDQDDAARLVKLARVWISVGTDTPAVGEGGFIRPDGAFEEWTDGAVSVLADADCRITWVEWG